MLGIRQQIFLKIHSKILLLLYVRNIGKDQNEFPHRYLTRAMTVSIGIATGYKSLQTLSI